MTGEQTIYPRQSPIWIPVTFLYTDFQTAATTLNVNIFSLPIKGVIHGIFLKHSIAFAGSSITAVTLSVGINGNTAKYASAFDILQAVSGTAFQLSEDLGMESYTAATDISATITSTGANLSALSAGSITIQVLASLVN